MSAAQTELTLTANAKITAATSCITRHHVCLATTRFLYLWKKTKKTEKKQKHWMKMCDVSVGVSEHWSLYVEMISFLFFLFIFEEWFWRCLMILRGFTLCSDWLCVVRNRKWVAVTNTMMTQRLFHVSLFLYILKCFFFFYQIILTRRATSRRHVTVNDISLLCAWCHDDDVIFLFNYEDAGSYRFLAQVHGRFYSGFKLMFLWTLRSEVRLRTKVRLG